VDARRKVDFTATATAAQHKDRFTTRLAQQQNLQSRPARNGTPPRHQHLEISRLGKSNHETRTMLDIPAPLFREVKAHAVQT
jgi:hypothetical protein